MSRDKEKLIRQLSLLSFLLSKPRPFTAQEIQESVEGYWGMTDDTFTRRFNGDRHDLGKVGIEIRVLTGSDAADVGEQQLYLLRQDDFRLPEIDLTPEELTALSMALAALDGRFAYARPLRLALTAICHGRQDALEEQFGLLPVALAPDEDARRAGKQLARLEDAVARGRTVTFSYPVSEQDASLMDRTLDPYNLFFIDGHWYVVGRDHLRDAIRTFRVTRINGPVKFVTEKNRDFNRPADYDPAAYGARPPWLLGPVRGTATISVGDDMAWYVERLAPHVHALPGGDDTCTLFEMPYADAGLLLSWVAGLGSCGELLAPTQLRDELIDGLRKAAEAHTGPADDPAAPGSREAAAASGAPKPAPRRGSAAARKAAADDEDGEPIAVEHLARAVALLHYLVEPERPELVPWKVIERDLGLTRAELEEDLRLVNMVNFGGGTYALFAEAEPKGIRVTRDVMADTFARPARLSPLMARALLLALDLLGDAFTAPGLKSLTPVREKIQAVVGASPEDGSVVVDQLLAPAHEITAAIRRGIHDRRVVELEYLTKGRLEVSTRQVEPYLLFRGQEAWYLEAFCLSAQAERTFKLERIRSARVLDETYTPRPEVDLTSRRSGQAFIPGDVASWATVRFQPRWLRHLQDRGTDFFALPDGRLEARIPYADEGWMAYDVLRFLGEAVLESPQSARDRIKELAAALHARYESGTPAQASTGDTP